MNTKLFNDLSTGSFEQRLFSYMDAVGLSRIELEYSGGGDSGGVDHMTFVPAVGTAVEDTFREQLEEALSNPIYNRHGSFADGGGYHVNGVVLYDAKNRLINISGTEHNTTYSYNEQEDDYEDEETSEEEWEETLFTPKDFDKKRLGRDFTFVYLYARDFLKSKLPEEFHNRMLTEAATNNDEDAVNYVKELS